MSEQARHCIAVRLRPRATWAAIAWLLLAGFGLARAGETLAHHARQVARVVEVRVREQHRVDLPRLEGRARPVAQPELLEPLEHAAVDQHPRAIRLEQLLAPGDRARRAVEGESHRRAGGEVCG